MKKTKNLDYKINKHIEKVSEELGIDIELLSYDVRYFSTDFPQDFYHEYLSFIEMYIKKDMIKYQKK